MLPDLSRESSQRCFMLDSRDVRPYLLSTYKCEAGVFVATAKPATACRNGESNGAPPRFYLVSPTSISFSLLASLVIDLLRVFIHIPYTVYPYTETNARGMERQGRQWQAGRLGMFMCYRSMIHDRQIDDYIG